MHTAVDQSYLAPTSAPTAVASQRLRILSYNIQVGISISRYRHYITHSWKHLLPYNRRTENLEQIARTLRGYDFVGLQEVDGGSIRSGFVNQVEHLAQRGHFPYWYQQLNRNLGKLAQHSNGLLSRFRPTEIIEHKLPGLIPGRGAVSICFGSGGYTLVVIVLHLALSQRAQKRQLDHVCEFASDHDYAIVMGDFNCHSRFLECHPAIRRADLMEPIQGISTYPSWRPQQNLDHILMSSTFKTMSVQVMNCLYSDHLPIAVEVDLPEGLMLG